MYKLTVVVGDKRSPPTAFSKSSTLFDPAPFGLLNGLISTLIFRRSSPSEKKK